MSGRPAALGAALSLAGEAWLLLVIARVMVLTMPLRRIGPIMTGRAERPQVPEDRVVAINWALNAAGHRLPLRTACYERGIAACWMLAWRGFGSRMHYGVGRVDDRFAAHVWVTSGSRDVVGTEIAGDFRELASF